MVTSEPRSPNRVGRGVTIPISRHASRPFARPSSIDRQPDTWKPPMATGIPASRNGRAMSRARGNTEGYQSGPGLFRGGDFLKKERHAILLS
jgi:hypothetical protein